jgi:methyl-accepting chemotaxis protein
VRLSGVVESGNFLEEADDMSKGIFASLSSTSVSARVFVAPVMGIALTVVSLVLADRQAEQALVAIDGIHLAAGQRREAVDSLVALGYLIHSDVSRHLALVDSGLEETRLQAIRDAIKVNQAKARTMIRELANGSATKGEHAALDEVARQLDAYAKAVEEMNAMAMVDRMVGIPMMAHTDDEFAALKDRVQAAHKVIVSTAVADVQTTRDASAGARVSFGMVMAGLLAVMLAGGIVMARSITGPLRRLRLTTTDLAAGRLDVEVEGAEMNNEIGAMAQALQVFRDNAREVESLKSDQERQKVAAEAEKRRAIHALADMFETRVGEVVQQVGAGAHQVRSNAAGMLESANTTNVKAASVASSSLRAELSASTAAAATEEMSASIGEIGNQVRRSFDMVREAVRAVEGANQHVAGLSDAAEKIGKIVQLIHAIAAKTNLLALNATIEAARAGDAGRGFAVVASEVKNLANQTATATEEISGQINTMQSVTNAAVGAIRGIGQTVVAIDQTIGSISAAMEQQSEATREIAANVQTTATETNQVSGNIGDVASTAQQTGLAAGEVLQAAELLDGQAATLNNEVKTFIGRLRQG